MRGVQTPLLLKPGATRASPRQPTPNHIVSLRKLQVWLTSVEAKTSEGGWFVHVTQHFHSRARTQTQAPNTHVSSVLAGSWKAGSWIWKEVVEQTGKVPRAGARSQSPVLSEPQSPHRSQGMTVGSPQEQPLGDE